MQKTSTSTTWFFGWVCALLLLCSGPLPASGQCPAFQWNDFTKTLVQPNKDCNTAGSVSIRYSNNVVGVDDLRYQFGSGPNGPWFQEVDAPSPGATVKVDVPTSMDGKTLFVRITTQCGTSNRTDYWSMGRIDLRKSETVSLRTSSTPAGSGVGSSGGVQAWIDGPSNFTEATFNLYKRNDPNTVIATQRSTRPYEGVTFFNLPKGDYTVIATAKPGCTPTTTASNWNDGAFKLAGNVSVGTFNLIATAIPSRGTCPGGVKVEASKVTGVQQIVYNLATQQDPNTVVQTYTANYPNFAHTFTGLATGKYVVSATEMTGNSKMQTNFEVRSQNDAPSVTLINHTMTGMAEGKVNVRVANTSEACPVKLTVQRTSTASGLPFTTIVKNNLTEENVLIDNLPAGNYLVTAEYGGLNFIATFVISESGIGLANRGITSAQASCDPSGSVKWELTGSSYFYYAPLDVKITNRNTGNLVRRFTLPAGQTVFETKNLVPGDYTLTVRYDKANLETNAYFTVNSKANREGDLNFSIDEGSEFCGDQPMAKLAVNYTGNGGIENAPQMQAFMNGATFEVYTREGQFLYSGVMPQLTGNAKSTFETPYIPQGGYITVKAACGYPTLSKNLGGVAGMVKAYLFSPTFTYRGCGSRGTNVDLRVLDTKGSVVPLITYTVKKKGTGELIGTYEMKEGVNTAIFANMEPGDYTVEWYPQCNPAQKHQEEFTVPDKVSEVSRAVLPAICDEMGSIQITFTNFTNIGGWRYELIRKSDNKTIRMYGSGGGNSLYFERVPAGEYTVKATPIVECNDLTPGVFDVTVPVETDPRMNTDRFIILWQRDAPAQPYQRVGKVRYYSYRPYSYVKWRVLDVTTNAEISKGEVRPIPNNMGGYPIPIQGLPQTYKIEFETPCGTFSRIDSLTVVNRRSMPGFDMTTTQGSTTCNTPPTIKIHSLLKEAGLPDKPTRVQLYLYDNRGSGYQWYLVKEATDPNIIEDYTFDNLLPSRTYYVNYFYDGTAERKQTTTPPIAAGADVLLSSSQFSPKGNAILTVSPIGVDPGATMKVIITDNLGTEVYNQTVSADNPIKIPVKKPGTFFRMTGNILTGCFAGQILGKLTGPGTTPAFSFSATGNKMQCKNDGEIKVTVPEAFYDVDQVHYTLKKITGTSYTDVAETTTPSQAKSFIGLEAGTYEISARATVFHDENNNPKVFDAKKTVTLSTTYRDGLYATVRPDYMVPTTTACPNGRIGLNIEKGTGRYRVYLKSTPDGPLTEPKELFTDAIGSSMYNKLWGEGLKPGHYSLTVTDGCMERDIPDAEILEMPNLGKAAIYADWYLRGDMRLKKELTEKRDSFLYSLRFDPSAFPINFQQTAYRSYEAQIVARGDNPDNSQWKSDWVLTNDGPVMRNIYSKRFNNCNGLDILLRIKDCPNTVIRIPEDRKVLNMVTGGWQLLKCNTVQWVFTSGDIGHKYHIKVKRLQDNVIVYEKDKTYNSYEEVLQRDPELEFPADKSYDIEMTPTDYCGDPLYSAGKRFNAVQRNYRYSLDDGTIMSDCDGRLLAIQGWTDCRLPMKYFVYEVKGGTETLVDQTGNYVPDRWYSQYKFLRDHRYIIRVVEYGQPETNKIDLVDFTLNYRLPGKYRLSEGYRLTNVTFCGQGYDAAKKGYNLSSFNSYFGNADWTGVPAVEQKTYLTVPKMTIIATQKAAPNRKFVATKVERYSDSYMRRLQWKEELADGSLADFAYAPEGEYTMVAHTVCGDIPMEDEYLGRPTADLSPSTISKACDGKFTVTPKGTVTYRGNTSDVEVTSFYVKGDNANTTRNWGQSFDTYQREFTLVLNVKRKSDNKVCTIEWPFSMSNYVLDFDQSQALSMFCTDSGKGIIHMALKGGQPPYTYKLSTMDGTEIERKTVQGAVDFEHGTLGQRFRITATDACNLTWIHQDVLLQDPAAISSSMNEKKSYCAGDHVKMAARSFPGATYLWHLPDGSTKAGREIEFDATTASAGTYVVDIHLTTCTVTLTANIKVKIASISEVTGVNLNQQACAGEPVEFTLDPAEAEINGVAADEDEIEYQWERTATPNDPESWTAIPNATDQNLTYTAAAPGVYYIRRTAMIGECEAISGQSKLTVIPGINVAMTPDEQTVTINNKDPFTLTAGVVTGNPSRTYQWQRSADKKTWVNIGNDETFTETKRFGNTVYYRRIVSAGACSIEGQPIMVRFKKRWPAYINPQVRQRALED